MDLGDTLGAEMKKTGVLLEVKHLSKSFKRKGERIQAVKNVSFRLPAGSCLGLIGESGCGKSTIASMVAGFLVPDQGEIWYQKERLAVKGKTAQEQRRSMQMIFQNPQGSLNPYMTVEKNLYEAVRYHKQGNENGWKNEAVRNLDYMGLPEEYLQRRPDELSGGECQRVAIARALMRRPELLICDEIASALDVSVQAEIIRYILRLKDDGVSMLFITHDLMLAAHVCDELLVMRNGQEVEAGNTQQVLQTPREEYTQQLIMASV